MASDASVDAAAPHWRREAAEATDQQAGYLSDSSFNNQGRD